ncbi:MAG: hypothetical protein HZA92_15405 [Verrucomicrobia bacterium]|nr:hypothetical protein [Verrucomicrobiota bacterium]
MNLESERLAKSIEQLQLMNGALEILRNDVLPKNPRMFAVMAEGPLEEIRRLHAEIQQQSEALLTVPAAA